MTNWSIAVYLCLPTPTLTLRHSCILDITESDMFKDAISSDRRPTTGGNLYYVNTAKDGVGFAFNIRTQSMPSLAEAIQCCSFILCVFPSHVRFYLSTEPNSSVGLGMSVEDYDGATFSME